jgi:hypothetical protein
VLAGPRLRRGRTRCCHTGHETTDAPHWKTASRPISLRQETEQTSNWPRYTETAYKHCEALRKSYMKDMWTGWLLLPYTLSAPSSGWVWVERQQMASSTHVLALASWPSISGRAAVETEGCTMDPMVIWVPRTTGSCLTHANTSILDTELLT